MAENYEKALQQKTLLKKAQLIERKQKIGEKALAALEHKLEGFSYEEIRINEKTGERKITQKFQTPDTASIVFALTNAFADVFQNKINTQNTSQTTSISKIEIEIIEPQKDSL